MNRTLKTQLDFIQRGGRVQRMHMIPTIHPQNVAAHSFGVAWWCWLLSEGAPSANLLMAALAHDLAEGRTGDIPAPTKHKLGISENLEKFEAEVTASAFLPVFELTEVEERLLKVADNFELLQHCIREKKLGNRTSELYQMWGNVSSYVSSYLEISNLEALEELNAQWREV